MKITQVHSETAQILAGQQGGLQGKTGQTGNLRIYQRGHAFPRGCHAGRDNYNHEDFGYIMEKKILALTGLGLGTCWIGGSLRREEYAKTHPLEPGWLIAAISPVGYPSEKIGFRERLIKYFAESKKRRPWMDLFFNGEFQSFLTPDVAGKYAEALEMVRLAPSANNIQPWRIVKSGDIFHFFLHKKTNEKPMPSGSTCRGSTWASRCATSNFHSCKGITGHWERRPTGLLSANDIEYISSFVVDETSEKSVRIANPEQIFSCFLSFINGQVPHSDSQSTFPLRQLILRGEPGTSGVAAPSGRCLMPPETKEVAEFRVDIARMTGIYGDSRWP